MKLAFIIWIALMINFCLLDFWECVERTPLLKRSLYLAFVTVAAYPLIIPGIRWYYTFVPFLSTAVVGVAAALYVNVQKK